MVSNGFCGAEVVVFIATILIIIVLVRVLIFFSSMKDWAVRFCVFGLGKTKTLACHTEVLHFKLFNAVFKCSVHLAQMYKFGVNSIDADNGRFVKRSLIVKPVIFGLLRIAQVDLGPNRRAKRILQGCAVASQNALDELDAFSELLVLNIQL